MPLTLPPKVKYTWRKWGVCSSSIGSFLFTTVVNLKLTIQGSLRRAFFISGSGNHPYFYLNKRARLPDSTSPHF